jgi:hypothetical protein
MCASRARDHRCYDTLIERAHARRSFTQGLLIGFVERDAAMRTDHENVFFR